MSLDIERAVRDLAPRPETEPDWDAMVDGVMDAIGEPAVPLFRRPVVIAAALAAAAVLVASLLSPATPLEIAVADPTAGPGAGLPRAATVEALDAAELAALDADLDSLLTAEIAAAVAGTDAIDWIADDPEPAWADALASLDDLSDRELADLVDSLEQPGK